jgi:hypothetical protein
MRPERWLNKDASYHNYIIPKPNRADAVIWNEETTEARHRYPGRLFIARQHAYEGDLAYFIFSNELLGDPHTGHFQSSGSCIKGVPSLASSYS